jgi:hypothetical protein
MLRPAGYSGVPVADTGSAMPLTVHDVAVAGQYVHAHPQSPLHRHYAHDHLLHHQQNQQQQQQQPPPQQQFLPRRPGDLIAGQRTGLVLNVLASGLFLLAALASFTDVYDTATQVATTILFVWAGLGRGLGVFLLAGNAVGPEQFRAELRRMLVNWHAAFALGTAAYSLTASVLAVAFAETKFGACFAWCAAGRWVVARACMCVRKQRVPARRWFCVVRASGWIPAAGVWRCLRATWAVHRINHVPSSSFASTTFGFAVAGACCRCSRGLLPVHAVGLGAPATVPGGGGGCHRGTAPAGSASTPPRAAARPPQRPVLAGSPHDAPRRPRHRRRMGA